MADYEPSHYHVPMAVPLYLVVNATGESLDVDAAYQLLCKHVWGEEQPYLPRDHPVYDWFKVGGMDGIRVEPFTNDYELRVVDLSKHFGDNHVGHRCVTCQHILGPDSDLPRLEFKPINLSDVEKL